MIILYLLSISIILCQNPIINNNIDLFISSPKLIKNQLCSFNGISQVNISYIKCKCYDAFVKDNNIRKINNYEVDCSYFLKSRLITFTLSLVVPLGIDYFYLGFYIFGAIVFVFVIIIFLLNICLLKLVLVYDRLSSVGNVDKNFEKKYLKYKYIVIFIDCISFCFYIINSILQGTGIIKDKNGYETLSDYNFE